MLLKYTDVSKINRLYTFKVFCASFLPPGAVILSHSGDTVSCSPQPSVIKFYATEQACDRNEKSPQYGAAKRVSLQFRYIVLFVNISNLLHPPSSLNKVVSTIDLQY